MGNRLFVLNHERTMNSCTKLKPTHTKHSVTVNQATRTQLDSMAAQRGERGRCSARLVNASNGGGAAQTAARHPASLHALSRFMNSRWRWYFCCVEIFSMLSPRAVTEDIMTDTSAGFPASSFSLAPPPATTLSAQVEQRGFGDEGERHASHRTYHSQ